MTRTSLFVALAATVVAACGGGMAEAERAPAERAPQRACSVVGRDTSDAALAATFKSEQRTLLIVGDSVVACECNRRSKIGGATEGSKIGGATEGSKIGGATEGSKIGGATEGSKIGGATEGSKIGGATEGSKIGGATEGSKIGGATEGSKIGGATEGSKIGGATEGSKIGGATEGSKIGGATERSRVGGAVGELTCSEAPSCNGFVFSGRASATFGATGRHAVSGSCIAED